MGDVEGFRFQLIPYLEFIRKILVYIALPFWGISELSDSDFKAEF
jgi:hypothetical protein